MNICLVIIQIKKMKMKEEIEDGMLYCGSSHCDLK